MIDKSKHKEWYWIGGGGTTAGNPGFDSPCWPR